MGLPTVHGRPTMMSGAVPKCLLAVYCQFTISFKSFKAVPVSVC